MRNIIVIEEKSLSTDYEKRYVIRDADTKELLDDAQGYGYKSIQKAYAAYSYKNRDKSKDKEKQKKKYLPMKTFVNSMKHIKIIFRNIVLLLF